MTSINRRWVLVCSSHLVDISIIMGISSITVVMLIAANKPSKGAMCGTAMASRTARNDNKNFFTCRRNFIVSKIDGNLTKRAFSHVVYNNENLRYFLPGIHLVILHESCNYLATDKFTFWQRIITLVQNFAMEFISLYLYKCNKYEPRNDLKIFLHFF